MHYATASLARLTTSRVIGTRMSVIASRTFTNSGVRASSCWAATQSRSTDTRAPPRNSTSWLKQIRARRSACMRRLPRSVRRSRHSRYMSRTFLRAMASFRSTARHRRRAGARRRVATTRPPNENASSFRQRRVIVARGCNAGCSGGFARLRAPSRRVASRPVTSGSTRTRGELVRERARPYATERTASSFTVSTNNRSGADLRATLGK